MLVVLHLDLGREWRGGQRQVFYLLEQQRKKKDLIPILASPANSPLLTKVTSIYPEIKIIPLSSSFEFSLRSAFKLVSFLKFYTDNSIIIHTHEAKAAGLGALLKIFRPKLKLIHTRRVSYSVQKKWAKKKYRLADRVVGVSQDICNKFLEIGLPKEKIACIPSAIKIENYNPRTKQSWNNPVRLGIIGAFTPQKGHEFLLKSLALADFDFELWIVGAGKLANFLKKLTFDLHLASKVVFKGFVESCNILPELDILLVPSRDGEGSSGTIKEGWAAGVPVIASNLKANLELVRDRKDGLIFERNNPHSLLKAIEELLHDKRLYKHLVQNGLQQVNNFTPHKMEQSYWGVYKQVIKL
ncbi:MAG: glycosyltransferase family 4 protein [Desulfonauticus sp.]|nr:glycosyltransferase family 4 protein [Desulfonauticus sp.]